jgi:hypothetical protein
VRARDWCARTAAIEGNRLEARYRLEPDSLRHPAHVSHPYVSFQPTWWQGEDGAPDRAVVTMCTSLRLDELSPAGLRWLAEMVELFDAWTRGGIDWPKGDEP